MKLEEKEKNIDMIMNIFLFLLVLFVAGVGYMVVI